MTVSDVMCNTNTKYKYVSSPTLLALDRFLSSFGFASPAHPLPVPSLAKVVRKLTSVGRRSSML